jgi:hypothetical protein
MGIFMDDRRQFADDSNFDPHFLHQLAPKALLEAFARLTLPAGEFPKAPESVLLISLANKNAPVALYDPDCHDNLAILQSGLYAQKRARYNE